ncbi:MAG: type II secretion system protein, partial [Pseudomonadales bacterium]
MFSNLKALELVKKFSTVEVNDIQDAKLRKQAKKLKSKQGGFTLLELLVVVSILAAIAGTATIALQDTDARASAAAHVAMMDELNKGIRTFRVLNKNTLPTGFDSLIQTSAGDMQTDAA